MRIDDESVREFFRVAATVDLTAHERDVLHLFWSNDDAARSASKDLKRMYSTVRDPCIWTRSASCPTTLGWRSALGLCGIWCSCLGQHMSTVAASQSCRLATRSCATRTLICVRVADGSGDPDFKVKSRLQFVLRQVEFRAE